MDLRQKRAEAADHLTKTLSLDVRFYGRSFSWLTLSHITGVVRGIATTFLMARWLSPEVLGQFRYTLAIFGIAGIFSLTGMNASVIRGVAKGDTVIARYAMRRMLQFAPLGTLVLFIAAAERFWHQESTVATALAVAGISFIPYTVSGLYGPILTGHEKIRELATMAIINNLLYATVFVGILIATRDLILITVAYFGFDILFRGILTVREFRRLPKKGSADAHMSLGHHMSGIGVMQTLALYVNQILLQRFWGYSTLAVFSIATVIPEQIMKAIKSMSGIFLQRLSRHEKSEGILRTTRKHFWIALAGMVFIVALYAISAPWLIPFFFPQYSEAVFPSVIYAIGLIGIPCIIGSYFFQAHKEIKRLWRFSIVQSIIQLATSIALVPIFGSWGAIWSRVATRVGSLPFSYPALTLKKETNEDNNKPSESGS